MLVIFDCDGVLVDTEPLANASFSRAIRAQGLNAREDFCGGFAGNALVNNSLEERFVDAVALIQLELKFTGTGDDVREMRVVSSQKFVRSDIVKGKGRLLVGCLHYHRAPSIAKFVSSSKSLAAMSKRL